MTTWNYTWRNLEIACNKSSSIKKMCQDLLSEEAPCGSILVSDHSSLCILGGRLREGRLYIQKCRIAFRVGIYWCELSPKRRLPILRNWMNTCEVEGLFISTCVLGSIANRCSANEPTLLPEKRTRKRGGKRTLVYAKSQNHWFKKVSSLCSRRCLVCFSFVFRKVRGQTRKRWRRGRGKEAKPRTFPRPIPYRFLFFFCVHACILP